MIEIKLKLISNKNKSKTTLKKKIWENNYIKITKYTDLNSLVWYTKFSAYINLALNTECIRLTEYVAEKSSLLPLNWKVQFFIISHLFMIVQQMLSNCR